MKLRLGTRGSELALTQSGLVADALRVRGHTVDLVRIKTQGDVTTGSLAAVGGVGVFAAALREALLDNRCDLAVHSFKDLPTAAVPGLVVAAVPPREEPFDVLCARGGWTLVTLPPGSRVGTGSPRRAAQLRSLRPDLVVVDIRGNVGTRLARVGPGDLDAVVLAAAGLARLGRGDAATDVLTDLRPAAAQGALAVECRADAAPELLTALAGLDDAATRFAVTAERAVLARLGAGCAAPVAAHAGVEAGGEVRLNALVLSPDGRKRRSIQLSGQLSADPGAAEALGVRAAELLLAQGAARITDLGAAKPPRTAGAPDGSPATAHTEFHDGTSLWGGTRPLAGAHVLWPRADDHLARAIRAAGAEVTCCPLTRHEQITSPALAEALQRWREGGYDWVAITSPHTPSSLSAHGFDLAEGSARLAVVGGATGAAVKAAGGRVDLAPKGGRSAAQLAEVWPSGPGRVLLPGSALAAPTLAEGLRARRWTVDVVDLYTTTTVEALPEGLEAAWDEGVYDAVVVTAGSVAHAVAQLLGWGPDTAVVAFGSPSARVAEGLGAEVAAVAVTQDAAGLVAALADALTG